MGKELAFHHDADFCTGCLACVMACRDYYDLPRGLYRRWVMEEESGGFAAAGPALVNDVRVVYRSLSCHHCTEPPCVEACKAGALQKRKQDGLVVVDGNLCNGCRKCRLACPNHALQFNAETGKIDKCNGCLELVIKGEQPACVAACPLRVLKFGPREHLRK